MSISKTFLFLFLSLITSLSVSAASLEYCSYGGKTMQVVIPSSKTGKALDKILKSKKTTPEKVSAISSILAVEAISNERGESFCEMSVKKYKNVTVEKCLNALTTSDMGENMVDEYDLHEISTRCKVGVNAMLFMLL